MLLVLVLVYLILIAAVILLALLTRRNRLVRDYRVLLLNRLHRDAQSMLLAARTEEGVQAASDYYDQQMDQYQAVSYDKMWIQFWKPLHTFYPAEFVGAELATKDWKRLV